MKWKQLAFVIAIITVITLLSCKKKNDDELNDTDRNFMTKAAISNSVMINTANIALVKSANDAVKSYARDILATHNNAQTDLKNVGKNVGYPIVDTIDPAHKDLLLELDALNDGSFDSAYMVNQVKDLQDASANYQNEQNNGQRSDVKNYTNTYYPYIQSYLERAESITDALF